MSTVIHWHRPARDLAEQIRGTDLDPFHDDSRIPAYLSWVGQHWDTETKA